MDLLLSAIIVIATIGSTAISLMLARSVPLKVNANFEAALERIEPSYAGREHYFVYGKISGNGFLLLTALLAAFGDFFLLLSLFLGDTAPSGFFWLPAGMGIFFTLGCPLMLDIIALKDYTLLLAITENGIDYWEFDKQDSLAFSVKWSEVSKVQITIGRNPSPLGSDMKITASTAIIELETFWVNVPKLFGDLLSRATNAELSKRDLEIMEYRTKMVSE